MTGFLWDARSGVYSPSKLAPLRARKMREDFCPSSLTVYYFAPYRGMPRRFT